MPYLKLTCPDLPVAERQRCAEILTDAVVRLNASRFVSPVDLRERCTVHFTPYSPDSMAIGGRLMRNRAERDVTVEYSDWSLSRRQRRRLARALAPVVAELFHMQDHLDHVNIRFHPYRTTDFSVGGQLLAERVPWIGGLMKRISG